MMLRTIPFAPVLGALMGLTALSGILSLPPSGGESASDGRSSDTSARLEALGPPPIPPDNPQRVDENGYPLPDDPKVELGRMLFYDNRLSGNVSVSCADCHGDDFGWTDGSDLCRGYTGTSHWRNCQTIVNAAYYDKLFWDGSSKSLEAQAVSAARGAVSGNGERDMMEERLRQVPEYVDRFQDVFGTPRPALEDAWRAIAAFERTLIQTDTPFDRYMRGDLDALSDEARAGLALFRGKAGCIACHSGPLLSDQSYYNLGVPPNPAFEFDASRQITFRFEQYAKGVPEPLYRQTKTDLGLYYVTKRTEDMGAFRTPSLRYLVYSAPYMHNGVFFTLEEVVDFYDRGGDDDPVAALAGFSTKAKNMRPIGLTDGEKSELIAFLESLSGDEIRIERPVLPPYGVFDQNGIVRPVSTRSDASGGTSPSNDMHPPKP